MARTPKLDPAKERTPPSLAETTPYTESVTSSWLAESMMQMQGSVGEMKSSLASLSSASKDQQKKLDRISHIIFAAGVVLTIVLAIAGFVVNKAFDLLMITLKAH